MDYSLLVQSILVFTDNNYVLFAVFTKILSLLQCYLIKKLLILVFFKTYKLIYLENVRRKLI